MRWIGRRESDNVEDRRSHGGTGLALGGGASILLVLLALFLGVDPRALLNQGGGPPAPQGRQAAPPQDDLGKFVRVVLADTEDVWHEQFQKLGRRYREPKLVLFTGKVQSACGFASAAVGPFYCPADETIYIDLRFYEELRAKFRAPGDFAQAYVIAHEVGHHVQKLLGVTDRVDSQKERISKTEYNRLSVRLELQADYLAGVWAYHAQRTKNILEAGDLEEALRAASAIGDDTLQRQSRGHVVPDSFTHGTSEQRIRWFRRGFQTGDMRRMEALFNINYNEL